MLQHRHPKTLTHQLLLQQLNNDYYYYLAAV